jgi:predicted nucleic acid-binding Zn ribbon protein
VTHWRRSPRALELAVEELRNELAPATLLAEVQRRWPGAVGPAVAAEAQPTAERGGVLTISCSASVWAHELDLLGPEIIERLNGALERGSITRLRCVAMPRE